MTKTKIGVSKGKRSTHNLSCQSITTTDLFKSQPIFCREVFKGDVFNIELFNVNRVDALPVSSFVNINNKFHWFYVKMSQIWKPFDAFMTKAPYAFNYQNSIPTLAPYFSTYDLLAILLGHPYLNSDKPDIFYLTSNQLLSGIYTIDSSSINTRVVASDAAINSALTDYNNHLCDFITVTTGTDNVDYLVEWKLSAAGRKMYNILISLGYRIPYFLMDVADSNNYNAARNNISALNVSQSALPLMAYLSILTNYFVPTKWRDYMFVNSMSYLVNPIPHYSLGQNLFNPSNDTLSFITRLYRIVLNTYYGSDYFTDSLVQPYDQKVATILDESPSGSNNQLVVMPANAVNPTPVVANTQSNNAYVDEYILSALKAVSSKAQISALTKNNMLASALQMFGYKPESSDMIPYLLKQYNSEIVVEPIVATAEGTNVPLGYKGGEAVGKANFKDKFDFDDYGFLICVNSVSPDYFYADGINREMLHVIPEDFFDPAYVNLGFQPIANCEVRLYPSLNSANLIAPSSWAGENTFGFQNKYAEYGYRKDFFSGDFAINTLNAALDTFHFKRRTDQTSLLAGQNSELFAVASYGTAQGNLKNQFDRIFTVNSAGLDHIQQWTYFKILAHRSIPQNGEWSVGTDDDNAVEGTGVTDNINN